jgi:hypothetical protein
MINANLSKKWNILLPIELIQAVGFLCLFCLERVDIWHLTVKCAADNFDCTIISTVILFARFELYVSVCLILDGRPAPLGPREKLRRQKNKDLAVSCMPKSISYICFVTYHCVRSLLLLKTLSVISMLILLVAAHFVSSIICIFVAKFAFCEFLRHAKMLRGLVQPFGLYEEVLS